MSNGKKVVKTDAAPGALGPYSQAIVAGGVVYCAGQIPLDPATGNIVSGGVAEQTAQALKRKFRVVGELAPGASVSAVLDAAGWPDAREAVLVVGHQPTLGEVAAHLLTKQEHSWSVRKGAVWWLSYRVRDGAASTVLKVVISPNFV